VLDHARLAVDDGALEQRAGQRVDVLVHRAAPGRAGEKLVDRAGDLSCCEPPGAHSPSAGIA
jgi:hypothetical protein